MKPFSRKSARLAFGVVVLGAGVLLASCGGSNGVASGEDLEASDDGVSPELTVTFQSDWPENQVPPWEDFEVSLSEITFTELITAAGDMDGATLIGDSCEQLQAEYPELTDCMEDISRVRQDGPAVNPGNLASNGTLTIPAPDVAIRLFISATNLTDDLCFFDGSIEITPGETDFVVPLEQACA